MVVWWSANYHFLIFGSLLVVFLLAVYWQSTGSLLAVYRQSTGSLLAVYRQSELTYFEGAVDTRLCLSDYLPGGDPDGTAKAGSWFFVARD